MTCVISNVCYVGATLTWAKLLYKKLILKKRHFNDTKLFIFRTVS